MLSIRREDFTSNNIGINAKDREKHASFLMPSNRSTSGTDNYVAAMKRNQIPAKVKTNPQPEQPGFECQLLLLSCVTRDKSLHCSTLSFLICRADMIVAVPTAKGYFRD